MVHVIMEAEKSHGLLLARWKPKEAGSVVLVQTLNLENQGIRWCKSYCESEGPRTRSFHVWCLMSGGRKWMSQLQQREQICPSSAFLFNSGPQGLDDTYPHWWGLSSLLSLLIQMLISSRKSNRHHPGRKFY